MFSIFFSKGLKRRCGCVVVNEAGCTFTQVAVAQRPAMQTRRKVDHQRDVLTGAGCTTRDFWQLPSLLCFEIWIGAYPFVLKKFLILLCWKANCCFCSLPITI